MDVKAHHGNIKDKQFGVPYMKQFDLVFNALDNVGEPTLPPTLLALPNPAASRRARLRDMLRVNYGDWTAWERADARRHVNRICVASERPLVDGGTTGYLGQVTTICKGKTACYDCQPKAAPKGFPVCTIRSTPDKPIHCIVWAKHLFNLLFGVKDDENAVTEVDASLDAAGQKIQSTLCIFIYFALVNALGH